MESLHWGSHSLLDHIRHILQIVTSDLARSENETLQAEQRSQELYDALLESGEAMKEKGVALRKARAARQGYIETYQMTGKAYIHAAQILAALQTKDKIQVEIAMDYIAVNFEAARRHAYSQPMFEYYQGIYERALAITPEDVARAKNNWDQARDALYEHVFTTVPACQSAFQAAQARHKAIMKQYDIVSTECAKASAHTSALEKLRALLTQIRNDLTHLLGPFGSEIES